MSNMQISELDFFELKDQIKSFLKSQERFKDYNFEGSNISVLLDVLAYNTYQNNFYNNMVVSELFLDSSLREESAISHAKSLNYLPRSRRSAKSAISFEIAAPSNINFVTIPRKTKFIARSESGDTFSFYTDKAHTVQRNDQNVFSACCIDIYEGEYANEFYNVSSDENKKYRISNQNVDTSSIKVYVISSSTGEKIEYEYAPNIFGVSTTDLVFFLQKSFGFYEIYFGRNIFGFQPSVGDRIEIEYRNTSGEDANGIIRYSLANTIQGYTISTIRIDNESTGGAERETVESIKFSAPKSIQVQERAITEKDYEILLESKFPEIRAISAIGGEKLNPPKYGKVAIFIDVGGQPISINTKDAIRKYVDQKSPLGISSFIQDAEYLYFDVVSDVYFDDTKTNKSAAAIKNSVFDAIIDYSKTNLESFGGALRLSKLIKQIDDSDKDILSNQTKVRAVIELSPSVTSLNNYELDFGNELLPIAEYALRSLQSQVPTHPRIPKLESELQDRYPTLSSSNFRFNGSTVYLRDDGYGALQVIRSTTDRDIIINRNVGAVDYKTGKVSIRNLKIDSFTGVFKIFADTKFSDISVQKNKVSKIKPENIIINVKSIN